MFSQNKSPEIEKFGSNNDSTVLSNSSSPANRKFLIKLPRKSTVELSTLSPSPRKSMLTNTNLMGLTVKKRESDINLQNMFSNIGKPKSSTRLLIPNTNDLQNMENTLDLTNEISEINENAKYSKCAQHKQNGWGHTKLLRLFENVQISVFSFIFLK